MHKLSLQRIYTLNVYSNWKVIIDYNQRAKTSCSSCIVSCGVIHLDHLFESSTIINAGVHRTTNGQFSTNGYMFVYTVDFRTIRKSTRKHNMRSAAQIKLYVTLYTCCITYIYFANYLTILKSHLTLRVVKNIKCYELV